MEIPLIGAILYYNIGVAPGAYLLNFLNLVLQTLNKTKEN